jgi:hypothetical protein
MNFSGAERHDREPDHLVRPGRAHRTPNHRSDFFQGFVRHWPKFSTTVVLVISPIAYRTQGYLFGRRTPCPGSAIALGTSIKYWNVTWAYEQPVRSISSQKKSPNIPSEQLRPPHRLALRHTRLSLLGYTPPTTNINRGSSRGYVSGAYYFS